MARASGFQIVFLVFAFEFFSMLLARWLAGVLSWPADDFEMLGQMTTFTAAPLLLVLVGPLRRRCLEELRLRIPPGNVLELIGATALKVATLFALVALIVLQNQFSSPSVPLSTGVRIGDDLAHWQHTLLPLSLLHAIVFAWLLGPLVEEIVFRGLIYRAFEARWGWLPSMAITSLIFGLIHPQHIASSMAASIIFTCVLRRTGTLWASIAVHALHNVVVSWPLFGHLVFSLPPGDADHDLWAWSGHLACLAFVAIGMPLYVWAARKDARAAGSAR